MKSMSFGQHSLSKSVHSVFPSSRLDMSYVAWPPVLQGKKALENWFHREDRALCFTKPPDLNNLGDV